MCEEHNRLFDHHDLFKAPGHQQVTREPMHHPEDCPPGNQRSIRRSLKPLITEKEIDRWKADHTRHCKNRPDQPAEHHAGLQISLINITPAALYV